MMPSIPWEHGRRSIEESGVLITGALVTARIRKSRADGFELFREHGHLFGTDTSTNKVGWTMLEADTPADVLETFDSLVATMSERKVYQIQVSVTTGRRKDYSKTITVTEQPADDDEPGFSAKTVEQGVIVALHRTIVGTRASIEEDRRDIRDRQKQLATEQATIVSDLRRMVDALVLRATGAENEIHKLHLDNRELRSKIRAMESESDGVGEAIKQAGEAMNTPAGMSLLGSLGAALSGGAQTAIATQDGRATAAGALVALGDGLKGYADRMLSDGGT